MDDTGVKMQRKEKSTYGDFLTVVNEIKYPQQKKSNPSESDYKSIEKMIDEKINDINLLKKLSTRALMRKFGAASLCAKVMLSIDDIKPWIEILGYWIKQGPFFGSEVDVKEKTLRRMSDKFTKLGCHYSAKIVLAGLAEKTIHKRTATLVHQAETARDIISIAKYERKEEVEENKYHVIKMKEKIMAISQKEHDSGTFVFDQEVKDFLSKPTTKLHRFFTPNKAQRYDEFSHPTVSHQAKLR